MHIISVHAHARLELFDTFVANVALFMVGLVECVAVGWVYGAKRFSADAIAMCAARRICIRMLHISCWMCSCAWPRR